MNTIKNKLFYGTKTYHQEFTQLCEPIKQYLGVKDAIYLNVHKNGNIAAIHSNYKWMEGYIEGGHYNSDPHIVHPDNMSQGFCALIIDNHYKYEEYDDITPYEAANTPGYDYGFTYVEKGNGNDFTALCFTLDKSNHKFINTLLNQAEIIKFLVQKLGQQVRASFPDLHQNKAELIPLKGDRFFQQCGIVSHK